uniref:Transposase n=1 Tax=Caulobacter sp. (strain K31) TaxID=366602 RepID=B0T9W1_CAUSK
MARKHGVSEGTIYAWKAKFGGMSIRRQIRRRRDNECVADRRDVAAARFPNFVVHRRSTVTGRPKPFATATPGQPTVANPINGLTLERLRKHPSV